MTRSLPLVSVVIPAFNVERYVGAAIESVLAQTYPRVEIVVVDDGSTDGTRARVARFADRVTYRWQEHAGIGAARNAGAGLASGDVLGFLDADDLFEASKIERQMDVLLSREDVDMVFGHVEEFHADDLDRSAAPVPQLRPGRHPGYLAQTMLIRREAFDRVGPFTGWQAGEFMDWYLRAGETGLRAHMLADLVTRRRLHQTNTGIVRREARADYARILKAALDRRRGQPAERQGPAA